MRTFIRYNALLLLLVSLAFGAKDAVNAVRGTITKLDRAAKTVVVKTADGTEHTLHVVGKTTVRGADLTDKAAKARKEAGKTPPSNSTKWERRFEGNRGHDFRC